MTAASRVLENPFLVLGLAPSASRMEIEREAQKLLGMIELGLADAATYETPLGRRPRTAELVRTAVATLRDPVKRLAAELWVPTSAAAPEPPRPQDGVPGWDDAMAKLGWRGP